MKKKLVFVMVSMMLVCAFTLSSCGITASDPGAPPAEVINPDTTESGDTSNETAPSPSESAGTAYGDAEVLENAVSVRIGRDGETEYGVTMYNNAATATMLNYLTDSSLLFPTYTYSEEESFVGQSIRGDYTQDEETTISDIKAGEIYLFSGGQLRLYFKDVPGANITATPVGFLADATKVSEAVPAAYKANEGDTWGVDVYFWLTKHVQ